MRKLLKISQPSYRDRLMQSRPLALWSQQEQAGTVAYDATSRYNGSYSNCTLNQPGPAAGLRSVYYNGSTSYCRTYTSAFASVFSSDLGTLMVVAKLPAGVWTDGVSRYFARFRADANNVLSISKSSVNNRVSFGLTAGGTVNSQVVDGLTTLDWLVVTFAWDKAANYIRGHVIAPGVSESRTGAYSGTFTGPVTDTILAAGNATPDAALSCWLGPCAYWNRALPAQEIAVLSRI